MPIKVTLLILLLIFSLPIHAAKLFGVELSTATKNSLSRAARAAGAKLKKAGGQLEFYDQYDSSGILKNSDVFFVGYEKATQKIAFAEYEFKGFKHQKMLDKLINKYGEPTEVKPKFISDTVYKWTVNGVEISFYKDWQNYKTRISYVIPKTLAQLKLERQSIKEAIARGELKKQFHVY